MEASDLSTIVTNTGSPYNSASCPSNSMSPPSSPPVVVSPCAACKILRRRCVEKCVLAPYFPPSEPLKFTTAHRVFGASNIIKFLQELPESQRADAVSSMVYEANARIRDPVYGCAGAIWQLQKQVSQLQAQLAKTQADLVSMKSRQESLIAIICSLSPFPDSASSSPDHDLSDNSYLFPANHNLLSNAAAVSTTGVYVDDSATWEYLSWA